MCAYTFTVGVYPLDEGSVGHLIQADFDDIETEFWRVVENGCPPTQAVCSLDLDSTSSGSGFPQVFIPLQTRQYSS